MLRLLTLGGVAIVDESDTVPPAAASQRRTLALLSALAVAGPVGVSRDKLVALFWPDNDSERGRHALTQALYSARRGLRCDDLFLVNGDVRLNPARITSDVGELETVLATDADQGVALYRGPFLDGFFLPGAAEFERWASSQRTRIEDEVVRAMERLANVARGADDAKRAAKWWKRAAAIRPLDSGIALRLMEALAAVGDRAGALRHASIHTTLLREELDLGPDPAVAEFAQSLREPAAAWTSGAVWPAGAGVEVDGAGQLRDGVDVVSAPSSRVEPSASSEITTWVPRERVDQRRRLPLVAVAAMTLVAAGIGIGRFRRDSTDVDPTTRSRASLPSGERGADAGVPPRRHGRAPVHTTR